MSLDWQWTQVQAKMPFDGQLCALRVADSRDSIHYGIGYYNARTRQWVHTAKPDADQLLVVAWMLLPS